MADCRLMLNFNGADADTGTSDDTGRHNGQITFAGTAQLSTTNPKFGLSSLLLDGDSDYLSIAASADWNIVATSGESWTVDFVCKHDDHLGTEQYIEQYQDTNNRWMINHLHGSGLKFGLYVNGTELFGTSYAGEIADPYWHHIVLVRVGDDYGLYLDGVQIGYVNSASLATLAGPLIIGAHGSPTNYFRGRMDRVRIDKSNVFSAAPVVGLTDTISRPMSRLRLGCDDDAASTALVDSSGNGFSATLAGGDNTEDLTTRGLIDQALHLDGSADYLDTNEDFQSVFQASFTIIVAVRPDDGQPAADRMIFGTRDGANNYAYAYIPSGGGTVRFDYSANGNSGNPAVTDADVFANGPATAYTMLAFVADSTVGGVGGKKIYVDGVEATLDASNDGSTSGVTFSSYANAYDLFFGARNNTGSPDLYFDGAIDECIVIASALTAAELLAIANAAALGDKGVDLEYEGYELLPEFPTLSRSPSKRSWTEQDDESAVLRAKAASGMPMATTLFSADLPQFTHRLDYVSDADKATLQAFYRACKARTFLWLNEIDSLKYQVQFARPPAITYSDGTDPWLVQLRLAQVSSQTV